MFRTKRSILLVCMLSTVLVLTAVLTGCGSRDSNTGSFRSRLIDEKGDAIINAKCFSLFQEDEVVYSGLDGSFRLSELPAGLNNIIIQHNDFALEQYQVEVKSDQETVVDFIKLDKLNASSRISKVTVGTVGSTTAEINWKTYKDLCCNIHYGTTTGYGKYVSEERPSQTHYYLLTGLEPETVYHFKVQYLDEYANSYNSYDYTFRTSSGDAPIKPISASLIDMTELGVVSINWTAPASALSVVGYNVYRQVKGRDWVRVNGNVITSGTKYNDIEAETGVFCRYAVTAVNNQGAESEKTITDLTFIPGVVKNDITLTKADSPIKLFADLIVPMGVNMKVEAGTEFQISERDSFKAGFDEDRVEILVHGALTIEGTESEPVIFSPLDGSGNRDHWAGMRILSSVTGISSVRNANIFGCNGYAVNVTSEDFRVSGLTIKHSVGGIRLENIRQRVDVSDCRFDDIASVAVSINKCFHVVLVDSLITNTAIGVENYTDSSFDQTFVRRTDIYTTNTGIRGVFGNSTIVNTLIVSPNGVNYNNIIKTDGGNIIDHSTIDARNALIIDTGNLNVKNNIFVNTNNTGEIGITYKDSLYYPSYNYNDYYGFRKSCEGCYIGTDSLEIDPGFMGGSPYSYELNEASLLHMNDEFGLELGRYGVSRL